MHEAVLARAALPAQKIVLGVPLKPYSLGHELYLEREQSSALDGGIDPLPSDLAKAVFICSNSWSQNQRIQTDWLTGLKLSLLTSRAKRLGFELEMDSLKEYIKTSKSAFPLSEIIKEGHSPSRTPGAPILLRLFQFLVMKLGKTEDQAWDYPYGLACMQWQAYWEAEGGLEIYNSDEAEFDSYVEEEEAKCQA